MDYHGDNLNKVNLLEIWDGGYYLAYYGILHLLSQQNNL